MALESILTRDGAQTVAAANYWNPGVALAGPNGSGQFLIMTLIGTVARVSTLATAATQVPYGILQNTPTLGQAADIGVFGISKAVALGAIPNIGTPLMWGTGGTVTTWSTTGNYVIGYNLEPAAGANQVISIFLPGPHIHY